MQWALRVWVVAAVAAILGIGMAGCGGGGDESVASAADSPASSYELPSTRTTAAAMAGLTSTAAPQADIVVTKLTKVSEMRVSRTVYDYVFKVTLRNSSAQGRANASARVVGVGLGTTIVDGLAILPVLAAGQEADASDTITLRHDRSRPFDANALTWTSTSVVLAEAPPAQVTVHQVELKPGVREVGGLVTASQNGTELLSDTAQRWTKGTIVLFQGAPRRVVGVVQGTDGKFRYSVEEASVLSAVDRIAFDLVTHPVPYDTHGRPQAIDRSQRRTALAAPRATADGVARANGVKPFDLSCVVPGGTVTNEGGSEYGVALTLNCSGAELLEDVTGIDADSVSLLRALRIEGAYAFTGKNEYHVNSDRKDNYTESEQTYGFKGRASLSAADLPALISKLKRTSHCKTDDGVITCLFEPHKLRWYDNFIVVVGGVAVPIHMELGAVFEVKFSANAAVTVEFKTMRSVKSGVMAGVKLANPPAPTTVLWETPTLDKAFEASAEVQAKLGVSGTFAVGLGTYETNGLVSTDFSLGGYGRLTAETSASSLLCFTAERGLAFSFGVTLFPAESLGFDGFSLFNAESLWPTAKSDSKDCAGTDSAKRVRLVYTLDPASNAKLNTEASESGQDVFDLTAHVLQDRQVNPARRIVIDFAGTEASTFLPANIEFTSRPVSGSNPTVAVTGSMVPYDTPWSIGSRYVAQVDPGTVKPGETIVLKVEAWVKGKVDVTRTKRLVFLRFERPLTATASYYRTWWRTGKEWNTVAINYLGDTQTRTARAWVATAEGSLISVDTSIAASPLLESSVATPAGETPVALWLSTRSTGGLATTYRVPIEPDTKAAIDEAIFNPETPRVGQPVKVHLAGRNLPDDLGLTFPGCWELREIDFQAFEPFNAGSEHRLYTCNAGVPNPAAELRALGGMWTKAIAVAGIPSDLAILSDKPTAAVGETVRFKLASAQDYASALIQVLWGFVTDGGARTAALFEQVSYAFEKTANQAVVAVLRMFDGAELVELARINKSFPVTGAPGPIVSSVTWLEAKAGFLAQFDVVGVALPDRLVFAVQDCEGVAEVGAGTSSVRRFACTFGRDVSGDRAGVVSMPGATIFSPTLYSFNVKVTAVPISIGTVAPTTTIRTLPASFEVTGANLPTGGIVVVPVLRAGDTRSNCQAPNNLRSNGFGVACELYTIGAQVLQVKSAGVVLGTVTVDVTSNVSKVTWASPSTEASGTVKFGETVTFTVQGTNLRADPTMGFAVEKCGVSNTEIGVPTDTARRFSCLFNNEAGAVAGLMTGVVKDAPGGQVLLSGWSVPVEVPAAAATGKLPHTGITDQQCYKAGSDALVACNSAEAIALSGAGKQDGMRTGVNPLSYSVVTGFPITSCVKDNVTGLMWEGKEAAGTRGVNEVYTNLANGAATDSSDYVATVNAMRLCGHADWRLPTLDELQKLVNYSRWEASVDPTWFGNTASNWYWTSTPYAAPPSIAWFVYFGYGNVSGYDRSGHYAVRLVRASL